MRTVWTWLLVLLCSCGPAEGQGRRVTVRPTLATLTSNGLRLVPEQSPSVRANVDGQWIRPRFTGVDGAPVFEVPEGPVLYEFAPNAFVYSSAEVLEPCTPTVLVQALDSSLDLELTLAQPAAPGDKLTLTNSHDQTGTRTYGLDAGSTTYSRRLPWRSEGRLDGPTIAVQLSESLPYDDFDRASAVGIFDAGILDPIARPLVTGTLEPVAPAADFRIPWDGLSAAQLGSTSPPAVAAPPSFLALRGGVAIATLSANAIKGTIVPMPMPALEPDGLFVVGPLWVDFEADDGGTRLDHMSFYAWRSPWPDLPEMKATLRPATQVKIDDTRTVSWVAPQIAPQLYEVRMLERMANGRYQPVAVIYTEETSVPIPPDVNRAARAEVVSIFGASLTAASCAVYEHLDSWARLPAFDAR